MDDERLHIRDVREDGEQLEFIDEAVRLLLSPLDVKGKDGDAAVREVPLVEGMIRMRGQRGVVDLRDLRVFAEEVDELQRVLRVTLHAQGERLEAVDEVECVRRRDGRARVAQNERAEVDDEGDRAERIGKAQPVVARVRLGDVREPSRRLPVEPAAVDDDAAERRAVSADELCRRMHNDIRAVLDGAQEVRRRERVVDDDGDAVFVRDLGDRLDVDEIGVRIADGLDVDAFRIRTDRRLIRRRAAFRIDKGDVDAPLLDRVLQEVERAAVDGLLGDDMVSRVSEPLDRRRDRRRPRGKGERRRTALKRRDAFLKDILRGVHEAPVDVARVAQGKPIRRVLRIAEHIGGRLIDGDGARVRRWIGLLLSDADLEGFETVLLVTHEGVPLSFVETLFHT